MSDLGIIGGTGLDTLSPDRRATPLVVMTPFGTVSATRIEIGGVCILFVSRHGIRHDIPPHRVNYRANVAAFAKLGVARVIGTNAVGSLRADLAPGAVLVPDDFIDMTRHRPGGYWDGHPSPPRPVIHTDFSQPYCPEMRDAIARAAAPLGVAIAPTGTYLCVDGPRYESPAEVRLFASWGADVVGMTGLPEATYAREAGLCYASIAIVTNFGAGLSNHTIRHGDVSRAMGESAEAVRGILIAAAGMVATDRQCAFCGRIGQD